MVIRVPIPVFGEVIVLTAASDVFDVTCNTLPSGQETRDLPQSTLLFLNCTAFYKTFIVYLADLENEFNVTEITRRILSLEIGAADLNVRVTTFTAS